MGGGENAEQLRSTVLHYLCEVEDFISTLACFFKAADLAPDGKQFNGSASGAHDCGVESQRLDWPPIDHSLGGYVMHVECGHNGTFDMAEFRHLALHLRHARFGRTFA